MDHAVPNFSGVGLRCKFPLISGSLMKKMQFPYHSIAAHLQCKER
jgi:hypothetical protein